MVENQPASAALPGQRLVDAQTMDVGIVEPIAPSLPQDVDPVVSVPGSHARRRLLDTSPERVIPESHHLGAVLCDPSELVFRVPFVAPGLTILEHLDQIPVGVGCVAYAASSLWELICLGTDVATRVPS